MLNGQQAACKSVDDNFKSFANKEGSYVVIGPMGFVRELGIVNHEYAVSEARAEKEKARSPESLKLCLRTEEHGAITIDLG